MSGSPPLYRTHHVRYAVYWDLFTTAQWEAKQVAYREEQERLQHLAATTVDFLQPGVMQPERDHQMAGENTGVGEHEGVKYRHAFDGGWFGFRVAVLPDAPVDMICTYWGSDLGARTFDILVDDTLVATLTLNQDAPGEFFKVTCPIPENLTEGKDFVTVRFQGHQGNFAGGLFGLRIVRRKGVHE